MEFVVKDRDTNLRDQLFAVRDRSWSLDIEPHIEDDLDNATVYVRTHTDLGNPPQRDTTAILLPDAMKGFGTMLGIEDELLHLFPQGVDFKLKASSHLPLVHIVIGSEYDSAMVDGLAADMPGREEDGLWVVTMKPDVYDETDVALAAIQKPATLIAAADFTQRLAEHIAA